MVVYNFETHLFHLSSVCKSHHGYSVKFANSFDNMLSYKPSPSRGLLQGFTHTGFNDPSICGHFIPTSPITIPFSPHKWWFCCRKWESDFLVVLAPSKQASLKGVQKRNRELPLSTPQRAASFYPTEHGTKPQNRIQLNTHISFHLLDHGPPRSYPQRFSSTLGKERFFSSWYLKSFHLKWQGLNLGSSSHKANQSNTEPWLLYCQHTVNLIL